MFAALSLLILAIPSGEIDPFLTFSKDFRSRTTTVQVGSLITDDGERSYWLRRSVQTGNDVIIDWTDTKRCSTAMSAIRDATKVTPPQIWVPGVNVLPDGGVIVTADGIGYAITVGAHYEGNIGSDIHFTSNVGTPLADWVEKSLTNLAPCWSNEPPIDEML